MAWSAAACAAAAAAGAALLAIGRARRDHRAVNTGGRYFYDHWAARWSTGGSNPKNLTPPLTLTLALALALTPTLTLRLTLTLTLTTSPSP